MTSRRFGPGGSSGPGSSACVDFIRRIRVWGMGPGPRMEVGVPNGVCGRAGRFAARLPTVTVLDASFPGTRIRPSGYFARIQKQLLGDAKTAAGSWIFGGPRSVILVTRSATPPIMDRSDRSGEIRRNRTNGNVDLGALARSTLQVYHGSPPLSRRISRRSERSRSCPRMPAYALATALRIRRLNRSEFFHDRP